MTEEVKKQKEKLKRKIWITRNARINMAERYIKKDRNWEILNFYYSICIIGLSLLALIVENNTQKINLFLIFLSVTTSMIVLFSSTKNYKEKALKLKNHYITLEKIFLDLDMCEDNEVFLDLRNKYFKEIEDNENHKKIDWIVAIKNDRDEVDKYKKINWFEKRKMQIVMYLDIMALIIMIIIPITLFYAIYCFGVNASSTLK